jgi:hypothetical protein
MNLQIFTVDIMHQQLQFSFSGIKAQNRKVISILQYIEAWTRNQSNDFDIQKVKHFRNKAFNRLPEQKPETYFPELVLENERRTGSMLGLVRL